MARGRSIKGITIEIGGDATGLQKALQGVNRDVRSTQNQLKDVEQLLKLDPKNTELLQQKQRLLAQEIEKTKDKLNTLKDAERQVQEQFEKGDIGQEQYDALRREIIETEQQLESLQGTVGSGNAKLAELSEHFSSAGEKIESAGEKLLPVTGAVVGLAGAAVKTAADFEASMSNVQAISGATADEMAVLEEKAREMGAKTKFSASEAADAMSYMAMAGWKTDDMLGGIEGIMNLAAASGEDLAKTSDIVTDALTGFGMTAKESGHLADIMAAASSNANTNVSMLGESFKYIAPVAGALGYSAEDVATALGLMANSGIKASSAGTSLRSLLTNLAKPTDTVEAAMRNLGISLDDGQGNMISFEQLMQDLRSSFGDVKIPLDELQASVSDLDSQLANGNITDDEYSKAFDDLMERAYGAEGAIKAQSAAALAGKEGMSGLLAIVNASEDDYNKLKDAIDNCDGAAENMANVMIDNLSGQITILKSQLQELAISFGEMLMPVIKDVVGWIQGFVDKINGMSDSQKKIIGIIALVVAALGPALIIIGKICGGISAILGIASKVSGFGAMISKVVGGIKGVVSGLFGLITAHPVIAVVVAVVAAVVTLYTKCEWFRDAVNAVWEAVKGAFFAAWDAICKFFTETLPSAWDAVVEFFQGIPQWWSNLWDGVSQAFQSAWDGIVNNPVIQGVAGTIVDLWENAVTTIKGVWGGLKETASGVWELIKNAVLGPVLFLIDLVTGDFESLSEDLSGVWANIRNAGEKIWNGIGKTLGSIAQGVKNDISIKIGALVGGLSSIWESIRNGASRAWDGIKSTISQTASNIGKTVVNGFKSMVNGIGSALSSVGDVIKSGFDSAVNFLTSLPQNALNWGRDFIQGFVDGINQKIGAVVDAAKGIAEKIRSFLHFSRPDVGPLRFYEQWMPDFIDGLAKGMKENAWKITKASEMLAGRITAPITDAGNTSVSATIGSNDINRMVAAISSATERQGVYLDMRKVGRVMRSAGVIA